MSLEPLTQFAADSLLAIEKRSENNERYNVPNLGGRLTIPVVSHDLKEKFFLDVSRGRIELRKATNQLRTQQVIILARVDINGPGHRNPDGQIVESPHIHVYREGFGDKWAYPLDGQIFSDTNNPQQVLLDFMRYCNIAVLPDLQWGLF